jgi:hypothetical protein
MRSSALSQMEDLIGIKPAAFLNPDTPTTEKT